MVLKILTTAPTGSPEWHAAHKGRISGSAIADILGQGRMSPYRRWAIITEKVVPEDIGHLPWIQTGNRLEPVVREWWCDETKRITAPSPGVVQHPELDYLIGTPDFMIPEGSDNPAGILECKTTMGFFKKDWDEGIPAKHLIQLNAYFAVTGLRWGSLAALAGNEFLWRDHVCDDTWLDWMLNQVNDWWEKYVLTDTAPPFDGDESDLRTLRQLHPQDNGHAIALSNAAIDATLRLEELSLDEKKIEQEQNAMKAIIMGEIGDNTFGVAPGFKWSWKTQDRKEYTVPASQSRVLRKSQTK